MSVLGQVLDILKRHVLGKQIRDYQDAKRMGRDEPRLHGVRPTALVSLLHGESDRSIWRATRLSEADCDR